MADCEVEGTIASPRSIPSERAMSPTGERSDEGRNIRTQQNPLGPQERQSRIGRALLVLHWWMQLPSDICSGKEFCYDGIALKRVREADRGVSVDLALKSNKGTTLSVQPLRVNLNERHARECNAPSAFFACIRKTCSDKIGPSLKRNHVTKREGRSPRVFIPSPEAKAMLTHKQPEALVFSSSLPNNIKDKLMKMEFVQLDEQTCEYLSLKWALARALRNSIGYLEEEVKIQLAGPRPMDQEIQMMKDGLAARKEELNITFGEIALINCPIVDCPTHNNQKKSEC
ncbi:uncharacterized protein TNCV_1302451 [Trichonephila clavipes]|nr:uncharacterized protein TNCV_1302451 [Trichonephila clavipes]